MYDRFVQLFVTIYNEGTFTSAIERLSSVGRTFKGSLRCCWVRPITAILITPYSFMGSHGDGGGWCSGGVLVLVCFVAIHLGWTRKDKPERIRMSLIHKEWGRGRRRHYHITTYG